MTREQIDAMLDAFPHLVRCWTSERIGVPDNSWLAVVVYEADGRAHEVSGVGKTDVLAFENARLKAISVA